MTPLNTKSRLWIWNFFFLKCFEACSDMHFLLIFLQRNEIEYPTWRFIGHWHSNDFRDKKCLDFFMPIWFFIPILNGRKTFQCKIQNWKKKWHFLCVLRFFDICNFYTFSLTVGIRRLKWYYYIVISKLQNHCNSVSKIKQLFSLIEWKKKTLQKI
jgi:hypothetical protein